jgi:hypothetical protein
MFQKYSTISRRTKLKTSFALAITAAILLGFARFCLKLDDIVRVYGQDRQLILRAKSSFSGEVRFNFRKHNSQGVASDVQVPLSLKRTDRIEDYMFAVPAGRYDVVDLELTRKGSQLVLWSADVTRPDGGHVGSFVLRGSVRIGDVTTSRRGNGGIQVVTGGKVSPEKPAALRFTPANSVLFGPSWDYVTEVCLVPMLWFGLVVFVISCFGSWMIHVMRRLTLRISGTLRGQIQLLCLITGIAVVASTYPVLFFGKSFVSPLYGNWLLYPRSDTVPGFSAAEGMEFVSSDVGATPWVMMPDAQVEHEAVFHHREFPLFNRYVQGGLPLFGQGQSMFGDPLHILPLLYPKSPEAWDAKFVLARWMFCFGSSLVVLLVTGSCLAGAIVGASCAFMGFYLFRVNHPAYFSIPYASWIILSWILVSRAPRRSSQMRLALALLSVASISHLCAGATKEGIIVFGGAQVTGFLLYLAGATRISKQRVAGGVGIIGAIILLTCPYWSTFLTSLANASTSYDEPFVVVLGAEALLGMFDNSFQEIMGPLLYPSSNLLLMVGVVWSLACVASLRRDRRYVALLVSTFLASIFAFGILPPSIQLRLPLLRNIYHVGNCFAQWLLVLAPCLAGFGIRELLTRDHSRRRWCSFLSILALMLALMFFKLRGSDLFLTPPFLPLTTAAFAIGLAIVVPLILYGASRADAPRMRTAAYIFAVLVFISIHTRFGMHLQTGVSNLDLLLLNARAKANLDYFSPGVSRIQSVVDESPARTVGIGYTPAPGYLAIHGVETIFSADALMNGYYTSLLDAIGTPRATERGWGRVITPESYPMAIRALDLTNTRFLLADPGEREFVDVKLLERSDFAVFERESAWPRAFFASELSGYNTLAEFQEILQSDSGSRPFALIHNSDISPGMKWLSLIKPRPSPDRQVVAAHGYRLTTNTTRFRIEAPSSGIVTLHESFTKGDFVARVNGTEATVLRINHAFKGIVIPEAGSYDISFTYLPPFFYASWVVAIAGLFLMTVIARRIGESSGAKE